MKKNSLLSLFNAKNLDSIDNLELRSAKDLMLNNISLSRAVLTTRKWDVNWTIGGEGALDFVNGNKTFLTINIRSYGTVMNENNGTNWGAEDWSIKDWHNAPRPLKFQVSVDKSGFTIYMNNAVFRTFPNRQGLTDMSILTIRKNDGIEVTEINNGQDNNDSTTTEGSSSNSTTTVESSTGGSTTGGSSSGSTTTGGSTTGGSTTGGSSSGSSTGGSTTGGSSSDSTTTGGSTTGGSSTSTVQVSKEDLELVISILQKYTK